MPPASPIVVPARSDVRPTVRSADDDDAGTPHGVHRGNPVLACGDHVRSVRPMTDVTRDDKDWTWVLERECPECGFAAGASRSSGSPMLVRANAAAWQHVLAGADVRQRPRPDVWSPLEYACHVRDVFRLFDQRLALMLAEDDPQFANWDQDDTAVADRYGEQDPAVVAGELAAAAEAIAAVVRRSRRRPVGAAGPAQRRRRVHRAHVRPVLRPRPGPPPVRRDGGHGRLALRRARADPRRRAAGRHARRAGAGEDPRPGQADRPRAHRPPASTRARSSRTPCWPTPWPPGCPPTASSPGAGRSTACRRSSSPTTRW